MVNKSKSILLGSFMCLAITTSSQAHPVEIPSDPDTMGLPATVHPTPAVERSWQDLQSFTAQTLENFKRGDKRGIFYVHSLEDIMGAQDCFTQMWNQEHPEDKRTLTSDNFHKVFNPQEFVDHYPRYLMANRPLISGSVVAFNEASVFNLASTFSPVNFILQVPPECIGVTDREDAGTPVSYAQEATNTLSRFKSCIEKEQKNLKTLDALVRFPNIRFPNSPEPSFKHFNVMNEVAILTCAQRGEECYRPQIVAVLLNHNQPTSGFDYGNASRNQFWAEAAANFAKDKQLPLLTWDEPYGVDAKSAQRIIEEWFDGNSTSPLDYIWYRDSFLTDAEKKSKTEFEERIVSAQEAEASSSSSTPLTDNEILAEILAMDEKIGNQLVAEDSKWKRAFEISFHGNPYARKNREFLLSNEQLNTYGLKRP